MARLHPWLLVVHIAFAALWLGGSVFTHVSLRSAIREGDRSLITSLARVYSRIGPKFFGGISVMVLLTGVSLVLLGNWSWASVWILVSLGLWLLIGMIGSVPGNRSVKALSEDPSAEAVATHGRFGWVDSALIVVVLFLMVLKP